MSLFNSLSITGYNAILFFPIVTFILDKDVPLTVALNHPILYRHSAKSQTFNTWTFLRWMLRAVVHATLLFAFTVQSRGDTYHQAHYGYASDYETLGMTRSASFHSFVLSAFVAPSVRVLCGADLWLAAADCVVQVW